MGNLQKEFIPYELALRMKALGFNEFTRFYITTDNVLNTISESPFSMFQYNRESNEDDTDSLVAAPTFSQAFRWFRENHGLKGYIEPVEFIDDNTETYHWCIYNICNSGNSQLTHEEAELACLEKLLEIVEKQEKK
jgi:hypothetical protein